MTKPSLREQQRRTQVQRADLRSRQRSFNRFVASNEDNIPFVSQSCSWDCGLACVEMALHARGINKVGIPYILSLISGNVYTRDIVQNFH